MTGTISGQNKELFDYAIIGVLHREGGFTDDSGDPGGATNRGISLRFLKSLGTEFDLDRDGDIDVSDLVGLNEEAIKGIYFQVFWINSKVYQIKSELLACKMLDVCVNLGPRQAWKLLQDCISNLIVDGIPGPKTMNSLDDWVVHDYDMLRYLRHAQEKFYNSLIDSNPKLVKYRTGWLRRAAV